MNPTIRTVAPACASFPATFFPRPAGGMIPRVFNADILRSKADKPDDSAP
jgi:hypothetical protein